MYGQIIYPHLYMHSYRVQKKRHTYIQRQIQRQREEGIKLKKLKFQLIPTENAFLAPDDCLWLRGFGIVRGPWSSTSACVSAHIGDLCDINELMLSV